MSINQCLHNTHSQATGLTGGPGLSPQLVCPSLGCFRFLPSGGAVCVAASLQTELASPIGQGVHVASPSPEYVPAGLQCIGQQSVVSLRQHGLYPHSGRNRHTERIRSTLQSGTDERLLATGNVAPCLLVTHQGMHSREEL